MFVFILWFVSKVSSGRENFRSTVNANASKVQGLTLLTNFKSFKVTMLGYWRSRAETQSKSHAKISLETPTEIFSKLKNVKMIWD